MSKKSSIKTGSWGRFANIGKSLAKAAGHVALDVAKKQSQKLIEKSEEVSESAQNIHRRVVAAKEVVKSMGELKGALMKIGQMISISEELVLPKEISALFKELQKSAPPMREDEVEAVFQDAFGKGPLELYSEFEWVPMAAASIGQVHRAKTKEGQSVAVKIQYPDIVKAIENDFKNLGRIKSLFELLIPGSPQIDHIIEELKTSLLSECDYNRELQNMNKFREDLGEQFPQIIVPKGYEELTRKSVLTMELLDGDSFEESMDYTQEERDELAQLLYDSYNFGLYKAGWLHTDPQNGNYLFHKGKIALLDFGSVRQFDKEFLNKYVRMLRAVENEDLETYQQSCIELGFFSEDDSLETIERHFNLVENIYRPYTRSGVYGIPSNNPIKLVSDFIKTIDLKGRKAPLKEFLLLDRTNLGLYSKIKGWNAKIDWLTIKEKYWQELGH